MRMTTRSIDLILAKKNKFARAALTSPKKNCTCSTLFCTFLCRCFAGLKRETSLLHIICIAEFSYVLTKTFFACVPVRF